MALVDSKARTRNFWFQFDCTRASEILDEMNKFSRANQIWPSFWRAFSLAQRSRSQAQTRRIAASGDEVGKKHTMLTTGLLGKTQVLTDFKPH